MRRICLRFTVLVVIVILSGLFMHYSLKDSTSTVYTLICSPSVDDDPILDDVNRPSTISCQNELGENVPWFFSYKLPKIANSTNSRFAVGEGYTTFGPDSDDWAISPNSINDMNSALGLSLAELYNSMKDKNSNVAHIMYNDKVPGEIKNTKLAHAKGLLLANSGGGLWLVHSVPNFPAPGSHYTYPASERPRAQIFLCMSLNLSQMDKIHEIFQISKPNTFSYFIPETLSRDLPNLKEYVDNGTTNQLGISSYKTFRMITTGLDLRIFAKAPGYEQDIYSDWIAPVLNANLSAQSWLEGSDRLDTNCDPPYSVYNVEKTELGFHQFSNEKDHSKWIVSRESSNPWTCIADLNRRRGQAMRGGGAVCTSSKKIWRAFSDCIVEVEECPDLDYNSDSKSV